jgi:hypothetical protein
LERDILQQASEVAKQSTEEVYIDNNIAAETTTNAMQ